MTKLTLSAPEIPAGADMRITVRAPVTFLCAVNGQRDDGTLSVTYEPRGLVLDFDALGVYLEGFYDESHLQEEVVAYVFGDLVSALSPRALSIELSLENQPTTVRLQTR